MKFLLDTHLLLWAAGRHERLPNAVRGVILDPDSEIVFSAASLWEVTIKHTPGRADFRVDPRLLRRGLLDAGYQDLTITSAHAVAVQDLPALHPALHRDPFDRLLVAQSVVEGITLLTTGPLVGQYPGPVRQV
ncbi:type II toxin-antitoxin system VapC family toxin [Rhodopila sp.]|uniref:type II toxin-antitoxin system VapC family toxin n=1 Tax=Rhodopila sp. TaxID=2480087 RepID=UPI003D11B701